MGFVTNDKKRADEQRPGGIGLSMDLGLLACPSCRREVPEWLDECDDCGVAPVPRSELGSLMPAVPAHLLADEDPDQDPDAVDGNDDAATEDRATEHPTTDGDAAAG